MVASNEENKKLVTEDYLGLTDGEDIDVVDYSLVPFMDTSINIKKAAEKIYFTPNGSQGIPLRPNTILFEIQLMIVKIINEYLSFGYKLLLVNVIILVFYFQLLVHLAKY